MKKKFLLVAVSLLMILILGFTGVFTGCTKEVIKEVPVEVIKEVPAEEALLTVFNPCGQPPVRKVTPMAPRLDTLDGKTIYVVSVNFPYTDEFVEALAEALRAKYPNATWIYEPGMKYGSYGVDDPDLWAEIQEKGDGMVMAIGH